MRTLKLIKFLGSDRMQSDGRGLELRRLRATRSRIGGRTGRRASAAPSGAPAKAVL